MTGSAEKSLTKTTRVGERLDLTYRRSLWDVSLNGNMNYQHSVSNAANAQNLDTWSFKYGATANVNLDCGLSIYLYTRYRTTKHDRPTMSLNIQQIARLESQGCSCDDWSQIHIAPETNLKYIRQVRFSGICHIGSFTRDFDMPGGMKKHSGIYRALLHNVDVGNDCCIEKQV